MVPTIEHIIFIPGVLLVGVAVGYMLGGKAVREEIKRKQDARKR